MTKQKRLSAQRITITAVFMAFNIIMSSFGIPVPGGHLYLCDAVICLAAILLNPFEAFVVGGIGSFIGDMLFYPAPMFVSLVTHGLQAVAISYCSHNILKNKPRLASGIGVTLGGIIMVTGYTLGKIYVYSTLADAIVKFPYEVAQAALGGILGMVLCWKGGLGKIFERLTASYETSHANQA
jgi:uncharacterized membrane protein